MHGTSSKYFKVNINSASDLNLEDSACQAPDNKRHREADTAPRTSSLTPLEEQVEALKGRYPDFILFVECGYRFRFFGQDAVAAAACLSIIAHRERNSIVASIPTHRVLIHAKRLLADGHRIGIVRQSETVLTRKRQRFEDPSTVPSKTFEREVVALFTPGTGLPEDHPSIRDLLLSGSSAECSASLPHEQPRWIVLVTEALDSLMLTESEMSCSFGIAAVSLDRMLLRHCVVENDPHATKLVQVLNFIKPCEIVIASLEGSLLMTNLRKGFPQVLISDYIGSSPCNDVAPMCVLMTRIEHAAIMMLRFYVESLMINTNGTPHDDIFFNRMTVEDWTGTEELRMDLTIGRPSSCSFQLDVFTTRDLDLFSDEQQAKSDIFGRKTEKQTKSLFDIINHCKSAFGERRLKQWLMNPLTNAEQIRSRQLAIAWFLDTSLNKGTEMKELLLQELIHVLVQGRRIDAAASAVRSSSGSCAPRQLCKLLIFCHSLRRFTLIARTIFGVLEVVLTHNIVFTQLPWGAIDAVISASDELLCHLVLEEATGGSKSNIPLSTAYLQSEGSLQDSIGKINTLKSQLDAYLDNFRKIGFKSISFSNSNVADRHMDYLVEISSDDKNLESKIPSDWVPVNSTKSLKRYHAPEIVDMVANLHFEESRHIIELKVLWDKFVRLSKSKLFPHVDRVLSYFADLDALVSLSKLGLMPGYIFPNFNETYKLNIVNGRHPVVEQIISERDSESSFIPNSMSLRCNYGSPRVQILSGPNMGGKSCYAKMIAVLCLLGQMGAHIPADAADMCIYDRISTVFCGNCVKNEMLLCPGKSSFSVEMARLSDVLQCSTRRSLIIMDELGRGTSANTGCAIAAAAVRYILQHIGCSIVFISHFSKLYQLCAAKGVIDVHVDYILQKDCISTEDVEVDSEQTSLNATSPSEGSHALALFSREGKGRITYLYKIVDGTASDAYGLYAARLAGIDEALLSRAAIVAQRLAALKKII